MAKALGFNKSYMVATYLLLDLSNKSVRSQE